MRGGGELSGEYSGEEAGGGERTETKRTPSLSRGPLQPPGDSEENKLEGSRGSLPFLGQPWARLARGVERPPQGEAALGALLRSGVLGRVAGAKLEIRGPGAHSHLLGWTPQRQAAPSSRGSEGRRSRPDLGDTAGCASGHRVTCWQGARVLAQTPAGCLPSPPRPAKNPRPDSAPRGAGAAATPALPGRPTCLLTNRQGR